MSNDMIIDVDCHHSWPFDRDLIQYMPRAWREYFTAAAGPGLADSVQDVGYGSSGGYSPFLPPWVHYPFSGGGGTRLECMPKEGGAAGSSRQVLIDEHLNPHGIARAVLTFGYGTQQGILNAPASVALCRAANDYTIDKWLDGREDRLYGVLLVPVSAPEEAAKEIYRLADHPRIVGALVMTNPFLKPLGHPVYDPILRAADETGLVIFTHAAADFTSKGAWYAGGLPTSMTEIYLGLEQVGMHHFTSVICSGVFEKFPHLRILFNEYGFTWMPWMLAELDSRYAALKIENPLIKRLPSEYFAEHVWASTQPFAMVAEASKVERLLETCPSIADHLCYSSDYPHWDAEDPGSVRVRLPQEWRSKVMGKNAARLFGWDDLVGGAVGTGRRTEVRLSAGS
ncbi:hypothetical protein EPN29_11685 [bacterium]|nr:MAG: hypothetical protein EPN29_11685 [bacterium]